MEAVATQTRKVKSNLTKAQLKAEAGQRGIEISPIIRKDKMAEALSVQKPLNSPIEANGEY